MPTLLLEMRTALLVETAVLSGNGHPDYGFYLSEHRAHVDA